MERRTVRARDAEIREAVLAERGRCLWVLDSIMTELRVELERKLLIESERHLVQVKAKIAQAIIHKARRAIVAGAKPKNAPPVVPTEEPPPEQP